MGKMSELDAQIKELRTCGETIIGIADALAGMFSSSAEEESPKKTPKKAAKEEPRALTLEDVRHWMTLIAQSGFSAEVKALITKYGARKLSDIDPSQYGPLMEEADALGKPEVGADG